jgi:hypothetical protein
MQLRCCVSADGSGAQGELSKDSGCPDDGHANRSIVAGIGAQAALLLNTVP